MQKQQKKKKGGTQKKAQIIHGEGGKICIYIIYIFRKMRYYIHETKQNYRKFERTTVYKID